MSTQIRITFLDDSEKNRIIEEIYLLMGIQQTPSIIENSNLIKLNSGIWLISDEILDFIRDEKIIENFNKNIKYCGIFLGTFRKKFGLSLESLYFVKDEIQKYVILKGKTLQKFLYGKTVQVKLNKSWISNPEYKKIIIVNSEKIPVGIGQFKIVETIDENTVVLEIESIVDLGFYLRKESQIFQ